ncbi:MAG TPA: S-layer homology domain-containing protein, partial [Chroococcales cyanobacterium]
MKKRSILFLFFLTFASPAFAGVPAEIYKDVPAGHWAENAIEEVAINRNLMQGYPDYTFRGEAKFSRQDFVLALKGLVQELETISKTSWKKTEKTKNASFKDLKEQGAISFLLDYGLFEGVLKSDAFEANHPVTRFELAKVIHNLLKLAEKKKVLEPSAPPTKNPFSDLSPSDPFYSEVLDLAVSYRVMVGFPDGTFRGEEELTRYQFAAVCAQTFPLIRELVLQAMNRQNQRD